MKIYTRTGDEGETSLVGGSRVSKASSRVNAYGDVDELISCIGLLRASIQKEVALGDAPESYVRADGSLLRIQGQLMEAASHLAADHSVPKLKPFDPEYTGQLEAEIDLMSETLPQNRYFVLPAGPVAAAHCNLARTVCRRAERSAIAIENRGGQDELAIKYLNRLSDYLFTLARKLCIDASAAEEYWIP